MRWVGRFINKFQPHFIKIWYDRKAYLKKLRTIPYGTLMVMLIDWLEPSKSRRSKNAVLPLLAANSSSVSEARQPWKCTCFIRCLYNEQCCCGLNAQGLNEEEKYGCRRCKKNYQRKRAYKYVSKIPYRSGSCLGTQWPVSQFPCLRMYDRESSDWISISKVLKPCGSCSPKQPAISWSKADRLKVGTHFHDPPISRCDTKYYDGRNLGRWSHCD